MRFCLIFLILARACFADAKTEADLRERLAVSEAQNASLTKDKAALAAALAGLKSQGATRSSDAATAARVAVAAATGAKDTADANAAIAKEAADRASLAAIAASSQADQLQRASDRGNFTLLVTQLFGFAAILAGFIYKALTESRDRRWALQDAERQHSTVIQKIDEVKTEAHAAFAEANTVNQKIASIGLQTTDGNPLNPKE